LRAAYAREAPHRPHWPRSFEQAIADPLTRAILRTIAAHPSAGFDFRRWRSHYRATVQPMLRPQELEACDAPPREPQRLRPCPPLDFKSRAAGEREEPDEA
jgi:hypothetical protein